MRRNETQRGRESEKTGNGKRIAGRAEGEKDILSILDPLTFQSFY